MAADPQIEGFDADEVRAGLRLAFAVGTPVLQEDQATFVFPAAVATTGVADSEHTPLDWRAPRTKVGNDVTYQVPCAIQYVDGEGKIENFGVIVPARIIITLLDQDYAIVKGFSYVVVGGNRYYYSRTETPKGLVTVGLFRVHCRSDDEG